jgi:hypothetical protein
MLTLWRYAQPVQVAALDPADVAAGLSSVHAALDDFSGPLPPVSLELEDVRRLLEPERSPALPPADRRFLLSVLDELRVALSRVATATKRLHRSPHSGNWLRTAEDLLLLDFGTGCSGPIEWNLVAVDDAAVTFTGVDRGLIAAPSFGRACASDGAC